jgi:hypothetical protein
MNMRDTVGSTSILKPTSSESSESGKGQLVTIVRSQNLERTTIATEATTQPIIEGKEPDDIKCERCRIKVDSRKKHQCAHASLVIQPAS